MRPLLRRALLLALPVPFPVAAAACSTPDPPPPKSRLTEVRAPCADFSPLRRAYFGDLHVHTALSFDAWTYDVRTTPADAYRFARGETIHLPPLDADGRPTFAVKLDRPLDFAAVTDHAEYLGEVSLCTTPGSPAYDSVTCKNYRPPTSSFIGFNIGTSPPVRADICGEDSAACAEAALPVWQGTMDAAEAAYDRTAACSFTTFVAYEYSLSPLASNLHRNVIFRNANALPAPITLYDAPKPIELWRQLRETCLLAGTGCDALAIPHNSNLSNGHMFAVEYLGAEDIDAEREQARLRADMEPLVEIYQHKGDSECINGLATSPGAPDELCELEKMQKPPLDDCGPDGTGTGAFAGLGCTSWRDYVRGALATGLQEEARLGVNPYKLGFIASTDTHNGTAGLTREEGFPGHLGLSDRSPEDQLGGTTLAARPLFTNPGGLAGVWAEENARDAIFDALRRRETFGTTGTRITLRVFAGWSYPADACSRPDLVEMGYKDGVPMGGDLRPRPGASSAPVIIASAMRDPGSPESPGTPLARLQIVKVWVGADGAPHEEIFDVAGDPASAAGVDLATCEPFGAGADTLCATWVDPAFDPAARAAYYARAVENPTSRWSTHLCNTLPADEQAALKCGDLGVPKTIQERAWSSPVWYAPK